MYIFKCVGEDPQSTGPFPRGPVLTPDVRSGGTEPTATSRCVPAHDRHAVTASGAVAQ